MYELTYYMRCVRASAISVEGSEMQIENAVAVVTGGGSTLGRATAPDGHLAPGLFETADAQR
jgi:hypothetical protein